MLLKLRYDGPLSNVAFKFNLRRYSVVALESLVSTYRLEPVILKPSLRVVNDPEGPHMIGRESDLLRCDWLDLLHVSRQF